MTTNKVFLMCQEGLHHECLVQFNEVTTLDGTRLPALRCTCPCGHPEQRERELVTK